MARGTLPLPSLDSLLARRVVLRLQIPFGRESGVCVQAIGHFSPKINTQKGTDRTRGQSQPPASFSLHSILASPITEPPTTTAPAAPNLTAPFCPWQQSSSRAPLRILGQQLGFGWTQPPWRRPASLAIIPRPHFVPPNPPAFPPSRSHHLTPPALLFVHPVPQQ